MSTPPVVPKAPPTPPDQPQAGKPTWLCQFSVLVDLPTTMQTNDMEGAVAFAIAQYFNSIGLPGNVIVQLMANAGNQTVATHGNGFFTPPVDISRPPPKGPGAPV